MVMVSHVIIKAVSSTFAEYWPFPFTLTIFVVGFTLALLVGTEDDVPGRTVVPHNGCEFNHGSTQVNEWGGVGWGWGWWR